MTMRTTTNVVTFRSPFSLPGWDDQWPAGDYTVTTDEELLDTSFPAYRRVSTSIALTRSGVTQYVAISPADLATAVEQDRDTLKPTS
jgi:hypothetical protein